MRTSAVSHSTEEVAGHILAASHILATEEAARHIHATEEAARHTLAVEVLSQ